MANPVTYAEVTLGVHTVYTKAGELHDVLIDKQLDLEEAHNARKGFTEALEVVEAAFIGTKRGENADMSQTAFEKQVKLWMVTDPGIQAARRHLSNATSNVLTCEHAVRAVELQLKIEIGRLHELGGYLQYLAAAKLAVIQSRNPAPSETATRSPGDSVWEPT